jgi:hypothetical protein
MCDPMGRREIFLTFSQLVEIEGHFTNEFVSYRYDYETEDRCISPSTVLFPESCVFTAGLLNLDLDPNSITLRIQNPDSGARKGRRNCTF